jgi:hypothetical protein
MITAGAEGRASAADVGANAARAIAMPGKLLTASIEGFERPDRQSHIADWGPIRHTELLAPNRWVGRGVSFNRGLLFSGGSSHFGARQQHCRGT